MDYNDRWSKENFIEYRKLINTIHGENRSEPFHHLKTNHHSVYFQKNF
jgi:hypothetical protein